MNFSFKWLLHDQSEPTELKSSRLNEPKLKQGSTEPISIQPNQKFNFVNS